MITKLTGEEDGKEERKFIGYLKKENVIEIQHRISKWIYRDSLIYTLDNSNQKFYVYDENVNMVSKFGEKGDAPWEGRDIVFFEVSDSNIYIIDYGKMSIKSCSIPIKNTVINYYKSKDNFWSGSKLNNDLYLLLFESHENNDGNFFFNVIDISSKRQLSSLSFKTIVKTDDKQQYLNVAYEGYFYKNSGSDVFYVCSKAGLFLHFNSDGEFLYAAQTIDKSPAPTIRTKTNGNFTFYIKEPDYSINYSVSIDNHYLYILSLIRFIKSDQLVIDLYRIIDGKYEGSIEIPNFNEQLPIKILKISNNGFMVLYEDMALIKYKLLKY
jgi:hypothetical protein